MSNREVILSAALRLFNEHGTGAITTNRVAEDCGVSIGNLYYHFRKKEEIVLELFSRLDGAWQSRLTVPDPARVTWSDLRDLIAEHFAIVWEYRFFYREQIALRQNDATLTRRWNAANVRGRSDMAGLLTAYLACEGREAPDRIDIGRLTDAAWLIADFWLVHHEMRHGPVQRRMLDEGVELFTSIMKPLIDASVSATSHGGSRRAAD